MTKNRDQIEEFRKEHPDAAVVYEKDDQLFLDDPVAAAMIRAVGKHNCRNLFEINTDRIEHFKRRQVERGMTAEQIVIVLLNVDDVHGGEIANILMPNHDWQEIRDRGEIPVARGLATRAGIQSILDRFDTDAADKLRDMTKLAVVVVDYGVAEIFEA